MSNRDWERLRKHQVVYYCRFKRKYIDCKTDEPMSVAEAMDLIAQLDRMSKEGKFRRLRRKRFRAKVSKRGVNEAVEKHEIKEHNGTAYVLASPSDFFRRRQLAMQKALATVK